MIFRDKWKSIKNHRRWFSLPKWSISFVFRLWFSHPKWPSFTENHPQKVGTHFWGWSCPFSMTKRMIIFSLWQEENPPYRNERKESHPEKLCRHIEMRRTNPPPIHNQSICFHLKMTVILRPPKWLSFIISSRSVIAKNVPVRSVILHRILHQKTANKLVQKLGHKCTNFTPKLSFLYFAPKMELRF